MRSSNDCDSVFVDFIIVCYRNDPADLGNLRSSLLEGAARLGKEAQVTLVSNDGTTIEPHPRGRLIAGQGNVGFGAGVNLGVRTTSARYVVIVNPDCEPSPEAVAAFLKFLGPGCGLLTPTIVDASGKPDYQLYEQWTYTPARRCSARVCRRLFARALTDGSVRLIDLPRFAKLPGTFVAAETEVARRLDAPFSERFFLYGEDRDLTVRARKAGIPVRLVPGVHVHHIGGVSGGGSQAIAKCKADSLVRIAHRRYGYWGAALAVLDMWFIAQAGRGQISPDAAGWAARRWLFRRAEAPPCGPETVGLAPKQAAP